MKFEGWGEPEGGERVAERHADAAGGLGAWQGFGFASRSCCWDPWAALAEARWPRADSIALSGLKRFGVGRTREGEIAF